MEIGSYKIIDLGNGKYKIECICCSGTTKLTKIICGGDLETVLSVIFIGSEHKVEMVEGVC